MYNEPDWSSLSLSELLGKAHEFVREAYGKSLSGYAFFQRTLDRTQGESIQGDDIVGLIDKINQVQKLLIELVTETSNLINQTKGV